MFLGHKGSLNHTEPMQPSAFTSYSTVRALCFRLLSELYDGGAAKFRPAQLQYRLR